jgi:hypothetical protein
VRGLLGWTIALRGILAARVDPLGGESHAH